MLIINRHMPLRDRHLIAHGNANRLRKNLVGNPHVMLAARERAQSEMLELELERIYLGFSFAFYARSVGKDVGGYFLFSSCF